MIILGIETSCDETSVAVVEDGRHVLSNVISSQIEVHRKYGGVVPELASRHHIKNIVYVYEQALKEAQLSLDDVDAIAVTNGPGLVGSLLVGLNFARAIAYVKKKKFFAINHIEAHIYANLIEHKELTPPFIALIVSGGHTMLVHYKAYGEFEVLGTTLDDAAGEAYDKVAKLLGLGYPGGPEIDKIYRKTGPVELKFPRPKVRHKDLNFSFSGLKTAVNVFYKNNPEVPKEVIATAFQESVVDTLVTKLKRAIKRTGIKRVVLAGGVSANSLLRERVLALDAEVFYPSLILCTDNAAMVAANAYFKKEEDDLLTVDAIPNLKM